MMEALSKRIGYALIKLRLDSASFGEEIQPIVDVIMKEVEQPPETTKPEPMWVDIGGPLKQAPATTIPE